jgi:EAL domain-containing protein (putative c-di-GMP-specific phosphodiesterase class I)
MGCDLAQGYFLSRPVTGPDLLTWLKANHRRPLTSVS